MADGVKYRYALDENDNLIDCQTNKDILPKLRNLHSYHCLGCGNEMVFSIRNKPKTLKFFKHKVNCACNGESYLHKLAKRRIRDKFLSEESFPVIFVRSVPCVEYEKCPCHDNCYCIEEEVNIRSDLKTWNGKTIYNNCQEEVRIGEFQPDLLLTGPLDDKLGPVFIEIYKTHESEEPKISSKYKIIETTKIKSEEDIDDIINNGFIEDKNCHIYNFNPKLPSIRKKDVPIDRFVLFKSGAAKVFRAIDNEVTCDKLYQKVVPYSLRELNMKGEIDIWGELEENNQLDSYQTGLVYLVKKGMNIKNCILCKYYKYNDYHGTHICVLYKIFGLLSPMQSTANTCIRYELNEKLMKHPLSELEKEVSEVP